MHNDRVIRSSLSYAGEEDLWENFGLVARPTIDEDTSEGIVVSLDDEEKFVFSQQPKLSFRDRLRIALTGILPDLRVEHHYVKYYDPQRDQLITRTRAERDWLLAAAPRHESPQIEPDPKEQSRRVMEMMQTRPPAVGPQTIQMLKDLKKREGQITVKLPAGITLTREQRREISAFIRHLARRGYDNVGEVLVPKSAS